MISYKLVTHLVTQL